jgi:nicotinamide-nucleotide amidase
VVFAPTLIERTRNVLEACRANELTIATAESCTGGLLAGCLTEIAGSSGVFERGFVTYSNRAKTEMLNVSAPLIEKVGAVSEEVARAMAQGALARSTADLSLAVTGIAGPGGGTEAKPVGLVHIACARREVGVLHERHVFSGNREAVRLATLETALDLLKRRADESQA